MYIYIYILLYHNSTTNDLFYVKIYKNVLLINIYYLSFIIFTNNNNNKK